MKIFKKMSKNIKKKWKNLSKKNKLKKPRMIWLLLKKPINNLTSFRDFKNNLLMKNLKNNMRSGYIEEWWLKELLDLEDLKEWLYKVIKNRKDSNLKWNKDWEKLREDKPKRLEKLLRRREKELKKLQLRLRKLDKEQKTLDKEQQLRLQLREQS